MTSKELDIIFAECETLIQGDLQLTHILSTDFGEDCVKLVFKLEDNTLVEFIYDLITTRLYLLIDEKEQITEYVANILPSKRETESTRETQKEELAPEKVAELIIKKLVEKRNGGDIPQDFRILEIREGEKEKRWSFRPPLENYRILIGSSLKGTQSFIYFYKEHFVCRVTKSNQKRMFLTLR